MDKKLRLGVVGVGNMGSSHINMYVDGSLPEVEVTAACDVKQDRLDWAKERVPGIATFLNYSDMLDSGLIDAVIVATPHYFHPPMVKEALGKGIHALSEKPAGVYTKDVRELIEYSKTVDATYAIMFNQRTNCVYRKAKELVASGKYGEIRRVNWIITDWFRSQSYYDSGGWRATWAGEGGGVLMNQCPHQLDLWQWICGMPSKVRAFCRCGKWHDIEVEDDVTIYCEYPNGASGVFITSTGDAPGSNRLEITLDKGKLVIEDGGSIRMFENDVLTSEFTFASKEGFGRPKGEWHDIETDGQNPQHVGVTNAFAAHILHGAPLIADGAEGINGLTIANAAFLSSWLDSWVELPIDEDLYLAELNKRRATSRAKTNVTEQVQGDMSSTY